MKKIYITFEELQDLIILLNSYRYLLNKYFKKRENPLLEGYFGYLIYLENKYSQHD